MAFEVGAGWSGTNPNSGENAPVPRSKKRGTGWKVGFGALQLDERRALCRSEATSNVVPVDDVPQRSDVVRLHVLVLQVPGVLPSINDEQRD